MKRSLVIATAILTGLAGSLLALRKVGHWVATALELINDIEMDD